MAKVVGVDNTVAKRCTCKKCASIIEYLPIDILTEVSKDYSGGRDVYSFITCPTCSNTVYVSKF
jgi:hypothetical protein